MENNNKYKNTLSSTFWLILGPSVAVSFLLGSKIGKVIIDQKRNEKQTVQETIKNETQTNPVDTIMYNSVQYNR